ncbi:hypothetical protein [Flavobacterium sp. HNIBRBA15423]|uniref:hypothetical protein n=1 Tax=Flavobacterium sp. HNIBRBA15423 TaxID=3458683 RepID=UPI0040445CDF
MKEKREKKISISSIFAIGILFCIFTFALYKANNKENTTFNKTTIAFASRFETTGKTKGLIYYFYNNEIRYVSKTSGKDLYKSDLKKFYKIKYNEENPEENRIVLAANIYPDSISLVKAGFKYKKYYEHDIATNTYIEHSKWE